MGTPLDDAKVRLRSLKLEAEGIVNLLSSPTALSDSRTTVTDLVASELGGAITKELFGRKRLGQVFGRSLSKQSRANQRAQLMAASRSRALGILDQTQVELTNLSGQVNEARRRVLLSSLGNVRSSPRASTIARRTILVISRIEALPSFAKPLAQARGQELRSASTADQSLLRHLEQDLREFISGQLSGLTPNWWLDRIPQEVRNAAERRLLARERTWPWTPGVESTPIHYVDFSDYAKILVFGQNWIDVFGRFFGDMEIVKSKLRELEPIRNDVAHSRTLSHDGRTKLRLYAGELTRMMRDGPNSELSS
jgi:HEPN superfamily Swt1-like protein